MISSLIFVFLLLFILVDLEVAQLVALFGVGHDSQPVPEVVLFQVLLGEILQVPVRCGGKEKKNIMVILVKRRFFFPCISYFKSAPEFVDVFLKFMTRFSGE